MAAIDKIYGSYDQYMQLRKFLKKNKPEYLDYLYDPPPKEALGVPLCNFPSHADDWLVKNCTLDFVQEKLELQHGYHSSKEMMITTSLSMGPRMFSEDMLSKHPLPDALK